MKLELVSDGASSKFKIEDRTCRWEVDEEEREKRQREMKMEDQQPDSTNQTIITLFHKSAFRHFGNQLKWGLDDPGCGESICMNI